eukprot:scaffold29779_cov26-Attheya_sp.AAC.1
MVGGVLFVVRCFVGSTEVRKCVDCQIEHFHFVVLFAAESGWGRDDEALAGQGDASACFWGVLGFDMTSAGHRFACNDLDGKGVDPICHGRVVGEKLLLDVWVCQCARNEGVA